VNSGPHPRNTKLQKSYLRFSRIRNTCHAHHHTIAPFHTDSARPEGEQNALGRFVRCRGVDWLVARLSTPLCRVRGRGPGRGPEPGGQGPGARVPAAGAREPGPGGRGPSDKVLNLNVVIKS